ncbi:MAG: hypothetical protein ACM30I_01755 [Gemmatimonas sp.]
MQSFPSASSPLARLAELEARYDGPVPTDERRALRHGTAAGADIAETRAEIAFFRAMVLRARRCGKMRPAVRNDGAVRRALTDGRIYLAAWRSRRQRLAALERERARDDGCGHREQRL